MKKRFTEGELNQCEVMMRDIKESARLAQLAAKSVVGVGEDRSTVHIYLCLADAY